VVVPQIGLAADAEFGNEGAPFRCLGLHTRWKAPAEAQTRFSEDPAKPILQDGDQSSTARHYRQAKHDSQNLFNISIRLIAVNHFARKLAPGSRGCKHEPRIQSKNHEAAVNPLAKIAIRIGLLLRQQAGRQEIRDAPANGHRVPQPVSVLPNTNHFRVLPVARRV
jgi:hypothetical protein